ncbi:unnamed protein product [Parascedosporium putredinis]|uniref:Major facilitator superfamily (MFS) profile domain-containing protein n=1 Tax=Parascedosporium putredinis TaxID=1442378 RepID=A0A9P1HA86_9PEZI|nr:unnamed protein product [Parascedosporium putredinis]CAI8001840.1 unnamed protein product [Parascedosporium putredinis]
MAHRATSEPAGDEQPPVEPPGSHNQPDAARPEEAGIPMTEKPRRIDDEKRDDHDDDNRSRSTLNLHTKSASDKEAGQSQPSLQQVESRDLERQEPQEVDEVGEREGGGDGDGDGNQDGGQADANAPAAEEPEAQRTRLQTTIIMGALCCALFLAALDVTIITTAVPTIASEFDSNLGYTRHGRVFIGSLLCGVSVHMGMLIASRAIQGVGGGGILALVNICISDLFSIRTRGFYFSIIGMVWAVASAIGPVLGGVFTSKMTWRWCFYINLPICGAVFVLLFFFLKLHNPRTPISQGLAAIDWLGSVTIVGGTVMFLLGLEFGGITHPWSSPMVLCLLIFGVAVGRNNVGALLVGFIHSTLFLSGSYYLPLYFQGVLGESSLKSGIYILPFVISLSIVSGFIGIIIKATGNYKIGIIVGMLIMTLGVGLFIDLDAHSSMAKIILYQIVAGLGVGPNFQSPLIAFQAGVEPRDIASATTTFAFTRQIAGTVAIVVGGAIFNNEMQKQYPRLLVELGPALAERLSGANAAASVALVDELDPVPRMVARQAYARALQKMYIVYAAFGAVGVVAALMVRQKKLSKQHTEHKTGLRTLRSREKKRK